jgi:hypothetical protein
MQAVWDSGGSGLGMGGDRASERSESKDGGGTRGQEEYYTEWVTGGGGMGGRMFKSSRAHATGGG